MNKDDIFYIFIGYLLAFLPLAYYLPKSQKEYSKKQHCSNFMFLIRFCAMFFVIFEFIFILVFWSKLNLVYIVSLTFLSFLISCILIIIIWGLSFIVGKIASKYSGFSNAYVLTNFLLILYSILFFVGQKKDTIFSTNKLVIMVIIYIISLIFLFYSLYEIVIKEKIFYQTRSTFFSKILVISFHAVLMIVNYCFIAYLFLLNDKDSFFTSVSKFQVSNLNDILYFVTITMTTIGYGDIIPAVIQSQILTIIIVVTGLIYFSLFLGTLFQYNEYTKKRFTISVLCVLGVNILFSLMIYFIPVFTYNKSKTLFNVVYYVFVTSSTLGYGDIYPTNVFGRYAAIVLAIYSIIVTNVILNSIVGYFISIKQKIESN